MNSHFCKIFFGLLFIMLFASCEGFLRSETDDCEYPDYSDCDTREPFFADLKISVLQNSDYTLERVEVFIGELEKGDTLEVIDSFEDSESLIYVMAATDAEYSARAWYTKAQDTFICVDGTKMKKHSYENCDSTCWYLSGDELDLILLD